MSYSVQDSHFHNAGSIGIKGRFPSVLHPLRWAAGSVSFSSCCWGCDSLICSVSLSSTDADYLPIRNSEAQPGNKQGLSRFCSHFKVQLQGEDAGLLPAVSNEKENPLHSLPNHQCSINTSETSLLWQKFMGLLAHSGVGNGSSQLLNCSSSLTDDDWVQNEISLVSFS